MSKKTVWKNLLAMFLTITLLIVGVLFALNFYTHHNENIIVPELKGMSAERAELKLAQLGLEMEIVDSGFVRTLPAGTILSQNIKAGDKVKPGRTIYLVINSDSSPTIVLPDISDNCSYREAESRLQSVGFKLCQPEYINGEKDWVYSIKVNGRNIATGTRVSVDARITLVVGNGNIENYSDDENDGFVGEDDFSNENSETNEDEDINNISSRTDLMSNK